MIASHRDRSARKTRWLLYIPPAVTCAYRSEWRRQRSYIICLFPLRPWPFSWIACMCFKHCAITVENRNEGTRQPT